MFLAENYISSVIPGRTQFSTGGVNHQHLFLRASTLFFKLTMKYLVAIQPNPVADPLQDKSFSTLLAVFNPTEDQLVIASAVEDNSSVQFLGEEVLPVAVSTAERVEQLFNETKKALENYTAKCKELGVCYDFGVVVIKLLAQMHISAITAN